ETMAIGRTFKQAFMKGIRSLELGSRTQLFGQPFDATDEEVTALQRQLVIPNDRRMWALFRALERGWSTDHWQGLARIDPGFLPQFAELMALGKETAAAGPGLDALTPDRLRLLKRNGFGDADIATLLKVKEAEVRARRLATGIVPSFKRIDTCA